MRSHTLFAIVPIALLMVLGLALPAGSSAGFTTCAQETSTSPGPYALHWKVLSDLRSVKVKGSVGGHFSGTCRGFATGTVTVTVKRRSGNIQRKSMTFENLEFKNGLNDTAQPFRFHFTKRFKRLAVGDCVRASAVWNWRFQNNEAIPGGHKVVHTNSGCVRAF